MYRFVLTRSFAVRLQSRSRRAYLGAYLGWGRPRLRAMTWGNFAGGLAAGVAAIVAWEVGRYVRRWWSHRRRFGALAGRYRITRKLTGQPEDGTVCISVSGNVLDVHCEDLPEGESIEGRIAMSERLARTGRGYYSHVQHVDDEERQLWGFWDVQLMDDGRLLVHATYAQWREYYAVVSGYVWTRIAD